MAPADAAMPKPHNWTAATSGGVCFASVNPPGDVASVEETLSAATHALAGDSSKCLWEAGLSGGGRQAEQRGRKSA